MFSKSKQCSVQYDQVFWGVSCVSLCADQGKGSALQDLTTEGKNALPKRHSVVFVMTGSVFDLIKHLCKTSDVTYKTIRSSAFYVLYLLYYIHSKNTGALKLHTRQSWKWKLEMGWKLKSSTFWWVHSNSKQTLTCSRIFWAVYKHYSLFSLETEVPVWKPNMQLFTVFSLNTVHTWNFVNSLLNFFIYSFISFFSYSENSMHHLK